MCQERAILYYAGRAGNGHFIGWERVGINWYRAGIGQYSPSL